MTTEQTMRALDQIRAMCDKHATSEFRGHVRDRSARQPKRLPSSREAMRKLGIAIAYSQGARSASIGPMIESGALDAAFQGFDHRRLAKKDAQAILRQHWHVLGHMRFRSKIDSIVQAARVLVGIDRDHGSFAAYLTGFSIPRRIRTGAHIDLFWSRFDELRADLRRRGMPFFNQTTSLLQLLLDLDYDSVKPDLIIMRLARRIGLVEREAGEPHLREAVWSLQAYSILRGARAAAIDWYLLAFGGQTEAAKSLRLRYCPSNGNCAIEACTVGSSGLCNDYRG